jgi:uncharacterized membrane protein (GlpM family)
MWKSVKMCCCVVVVVSSSALVLVSGLFPHGPCFELRADYVGFVGDKVTMGQVFSQFFSLYNIKN